MRTRCQSDFSVSWVPKFLLPPERIMIFGQKQPNLVQNMHFWLFGPNIGIFGLFRPGPDQKQCEQGAKGVFPLGTKTFALSNKNRILCPKTTRFGPKLAFLVILGQALPAHLVPCRWLLRAGCITQDTYLLYHKIKRLEHMKNSNF